MKVPCHVQLNGTTKQNKGLKEGRIHTSATRSYLCHSGSINTFELAEVFHSIRTFYGMKAS